MKPSDNHTIHCETAICKYTKLFLNPLNENESTKSAMLR